MANNKTIVIALDSAEPRLIEKWMEDGKLPELMKLKEMGAYGRVNKEDQKFIELPWLSFYNGTDQGGHGAYHYFRWISEKMKYEDISTKNTRMSPFWYEFNNHKLKTITVGIPFTPREKKLNGIEISSLETYDRLEKLNYFPKTIKKKLDKNLGKTDNLEDISTDLSKDELLKIKNLTLIHNEKIKHLSTYLIENEEWDLFMLVVSAPHRGGHRLWGKSADLSNLDNGEQDYQGESLLEIYQAGDKLIGEVLSKVSEGTNIIICSLHGMGSNQDRSAVLPEMLKRIVNPETENEQNQGNYSYIINLLQKLSRPDLRDKIKNRLPLFIRRWISLYLLVNNKNWQNTPAFVITGDYYAAIQINLVGREKHGIVSSGKEFNYWINKIKDGLSTFMDGDTGEFLVAEVIERSELGLKGEYLNRLPDLIINWNSTPASHHKTIRSEIYGEIEWPTPGGNPDGRSGNHRKQGFFIGVGEGFLPNSIINPVEIIDFAPTILNLMGESIPVFMKGKIVSNE